MTADQGQSFPYLSKSCCAMRVEFPSLLGFWLACLILMRDSDEGVRHQESMLLLTSPNRISSFSPVTAATLTSASLKFHDWWRPECRETSFRGYRSSGGTRHHINLDIFSQRALTMSLHRFVPWSIESDDLYRSVHLMLLETDDPSTARSDGFDSHRIRESD